MGEHVQTLAKFAKIYRSAIGRPVSRSFIFGAKEMLNMRIGNDDGRIEGVLLISCY